LERGVVLGDHCVQRDPHEAGLHDGVFCVGGVELRRVEVGDAVPQGDVRRRRFLGLHGHDATHRLGGGERLALQQQLAGQRGSVEPAGG